MLDRPYPSDEDGKRVTGEGLQLANPAVRFGAQQGETCGAVKDLGRNQIDRAASIQTVNLPTRGNCTAIIQTFQEECVSESLAMAKADHKAAYKQPPARGDREMFAVVSLKDPASGDMKGFLP